MRHPLIPQENPSNAPTAGLGSCTAVACCLVAMALACHTPASCVTSQAAPTAPLVASATFDTGDGAVRIWLEVANNAQSRAQGLMHRTHLGHDQGMIFVFDIPDRQYFWMHNTPLSLDMIFLDASGRIKGIVPRAPANDDGSLGGFADTQYVIEVNAGFSAKHRLQVGDRVGLNHVPNSGRD